MHTINSLSLDSSKPLVNMTLFASAVRGLDSRATQNIDEFCFSWAEVGKRAVPIHMAPMLVALSLSPEF